MKEIIELRDWQTKTYNLGGRKRRLVKTIALQNWRANEKDDFQEIDTTLIDMGEYFVTKLTPYDVKIFKDKPRIEYNSKLGKGSVSIELKETVLAASPSVDPKLFKIKYPDCMTDLDIEIRVMPGGIEIFKILKSANAPHSLEWEYTEGENNTLKVGNTETIGWEKPSGRDIELNHDKGIEKISDGIKAYTVMEEFTGRVKTRDPVTKIASWTEDPIYPVMIDVLVSETITAEDDDGCYNGTYNWWVGTLIHLRNDRYPAWRFQTVAIPAGATIDDVSTFKVKSGGGQANRDATFYGQNVDDAPAWVNGSNGTTNSLNMAKTASSVLQEGIPNYADVTIDVKAIMQNIIDRGGWATGQDIRIGVGAVAGSGNTIFYDYPSAVGGRLSVNYTEGGAAGDTRGGGSRAPVFFNSMILGKLAIPFLFVGGCIRNLNLKRREMFNPLKWIKK